MKTLLIVVLVLAAACVCFVMCVLGGPPRAKHVVVDMTRDEATVESRILAPVDRVPIQTAPAQPERIVARSFVDASVREIERLRLELDECRYPRTTPLGLAHDLPEWPHLDAAQRRDVEDFLAHFPVKLGSGEAQFIATYTATIGGDRIAEVIRFLGQRRVLDSLTQEQRAFLLERDEDRYRDYFGDMR